MTEARNIVLLGPPGTGKTHLAIGLGIVAARHGVRVLFATATDWVTRLTEAHRQGRLPEEVTRLRRYGLIVVDEVGYLPFEQDAANLFFQLVSSRYEHASLILTSNLPFSGWGGVFGDQAVAAAMIDRIVHPRRRPDPQRCQLPPSRTRNRHSSQHQNGEPGRLATYRHGGLVFHRRIGSNSSVVDTSGPRLSFRFKTEAVSKGSPFLTGPIKTIEDIEFATMGWVDWFNTRRLHSTLGYITPDEFEGIYYAQLSALQQQLSPAWGRQGTRHGSFCSASPAKSSPARGNRISKALPMRQGHQDAAGVAGHADERGVDEYHHNRREGFPPWPVPQAISMHAALMVTGPFAIFAWFEDRMDPGAPIGSGR